MSGGYDRYDLHREIDLSKVERIIYIDDATKASLAKTQLLAGTLPNIGNKIAGAQYDIGTILEKKAGSLYSNTDIPNGSELWLDGEKIWPFYREPRERLTNICSPWWQGIQSMGYSVAVADEGATNALAVGCPMAEKSGLAEAFTFNLLGEKSIDLIGYGGLQAGGFAASDYLGASVDINYNGTVVAIGAHQHNTSYCRAQSGYVKVKHLVDEEVERVEKINRAPGSGVRRYTTIEKKWVDKGQIIGGDEYDRLGFKVKLSQDGNTLAVSGVHTNQSVCQKDRLGNLTPRNFHKGRVKVYKYNAGIDTWEQKGSTLEGVEDWEGFGIGLDMTPDGNCIVVGSPYYQCPWGEKIGRAQVFKYSGGDWKRVGRSLTPANYNPKATFEAESADFLYQHTYTTGNKAGTQAPSQKELYTRGNFGKSVAINGDGTMVAIAAPNVKSGARAISVYGWNIDTEFSYTDNAWSGHSSITSIGTGSQGYDVALNDAGNILAYTTPGATKPYSNTLFANLAGKVEVFSWNVTEWDKFYTDYGPGAGSMLSKIDLSPSGRYLAMGSPVAPDRSEAGWDFWTAFSAAGFGAARVCDLSNSLKNLSLPIGGTSHSFSNLTALTTAATEDEDICPPGEGEPNKDEPHEEEPGSQEETISKKVEDPDQEEPAKDPPGSPPVDTGEPEIIEVEEDDGSGNTVKVKKQVHVTETKQVVYVTEWIDPDNCECEISSGKKNTTKVQQVYVPPEDGVLIKRDGTTQTITKDQPVNVPPGGTTYTKRPPGKKRKRPPSQGAECPFVDNWHPLTHYDCKFYDPDREKPSQVLGKKTDKGTYNSSKTTITKTATKRGYVTKENNPPNGKVKPEIFEPGDTFNVGPGESFYFEGGDDDDAGYEGGSYITDSGKEVSPSNVLSNPDSGRQNNTTEVVVVQKEKSCVEYCKCLKVSENGTVQEIDIREEDINLEPGDTLFRGNEKKISQEDPAQESAGYEGGTHTNDGGHTINPSTEPYDPGDANSGPFLSNSNGGTTNNTTEETEYRPVNNAIVQKANGTIVRHEVDEDNISSITLEPGDTIFEDTSPPANRSTFPLTTGETNVNLNGSDIDVGGLIGGGKTRRGTTNHTNSNSNIEIPPGHHAIHINGNGEVTIAEPGSLTLKPGESVIYGSDNGVGNTGYTGTGDLQNEEDVGIVPMDKLLSGGNKGIANNSDEDITVQVPVGKKGTLIGPNNEIKILGPGIQTVPPGWKINTGDDNGVDNAGYVPGTEINGVEVSDLVDDPDEGITNNTAEPICVPVATKEIEKEDGTKETLIEKDALSRLLMRPNRSAMSSLMRHYNIAPRFTNPAGIFRAKNPYTTISREKKNPDDCEPGYEKLQPGETMFRGKSNGIEDAEYDGGATLTNPYSLVSSSTDASTLVGNATSGLTNTSDSSKNVPVPAGHSAVVLDSNRRLRVINGGSAALMALNPGDTAVIGASQGISDAGYTGGQISGAGTDLSSFISSPSSGISNTSGASKSIQLGIGNLGLLFNRSTKETLVASGDTVELLDGFELYEGTDSKIENAGILNKETPYEDYKLSNVFDDDNQTSEGVKNTSSQNVSIAAPTGKKSFIVKENGSYDFPEEGENVTLKPTETLVTGNDYKAYNISINQITNANLVVTVYNSKTDSSAGTVSEGNSKSATAINYFKVTTFSPDAGYEIDYITVNGTPISSGVRQDLLDIDESNVVIDAAVKLKQAYSVTSGLPYNGEITFSWPANSRVINGVLQSSGGSATGQNLALGNTDLSVVSGTSISYTMVPDTNYDAASIKVNGTTINGASGSFTVTQQTAVESIFEVKNGGLKINPGKVACNRNWWIFEKGAKPSADEYLDLNDLREYGFTASIKDGTTTKAVNDETQITLEAAKEFSLEIDSVYQTVGYRERELFNGTIYPESTQSVEAWEPDGWELVSGDAVINGDKITLTANNSVIRPKWKLKTYKVVVSEFVGPDLSTFNGNHSSNASSVVYPSNAVYNGMRPFQINAKKLTTAVGHGSNPSFAQLAGTLTTSSNATNTTEYTIGSFFEIEVKHTESFSTSEQQSLGQLPTARNNNCGISSFGQTRISSAQSDRWSDEADIAEVEIIDNWSGRGSGLLVQSVKGLKDSNWLDSQDLNPCGVSSDATSSSNYLIAMGYSSYYASLNLNKNRNPGQHIRIGRVLGDITINANNFAFNLEYDWIHNKSLVKQEYLPRNSNWNLFSSTTSRTFDAGTVSYAGQEHTYFGTSSSTIFNDSSKAQWEINVQATIRSSRRAPIGVDGGYVAIRYDNIGSYTQLNGTPGVVNIASNGGHDYAVFPVSYLNYSSWDLSTPIESPNYIKLNVEHGAMNSNNTSNTQFHGQGLISYASLASHAFGGYNYLFFEGGDTSLRWFEGADYYTTRNTGVPSLDRWIPNHLSATQLNIWAGNYYIKQNNASGAVGFRINEDNPMPIKAGTSITINPAQAVTWGNISTEYTVTKGEHLLASHQKSIQGNLISSTINIVVGNNATPTDNEVTIRIY